MRLRPAGVRTLCIRRPYENPGEVAARVGPNHVGSLRDLLATLRRDKRSDYCVRVIVYAIAALKFTDRNAYDRYQAASMEVFLRHSGTMKAADEAPKIVEAQSDREKVVLMEFPDEAAFVNGRILLIINGFRKIAAPVPTPSSCSSRRYRGRPLSSKRLGQVGIPRSRPYDHRQLIAPTLHSHACASRHCCHLCGIVGLGPRGGQGTSQTTLVRLVEVTHHGARAVEMLGQHVDLDRTRHPSERRVGTRSQIDDKVTRCDLRQHRFEHRPPSRGQGRLSRQFRRRGQPICGHRIVGTQQPEQGRARPRAGHGRGLRPHLEAIRCRARRRARRCSG